MKIEFVNHASTIFSHDGIRLITDPWIEGSVFQNGWSLLSKTKFNNQDYEHITHIWFSHEHPDHFFPPNVSAIPVAFRQKIVVLYQQTKDKKVVEFCKKLGFKDVIELTPHQPFQLSEKFEITNGPFNHDSWLYIKTDTITCLNTNDCVINTRAQAESILKATGPVDVFLTQFSYAAKSGNSKEPQKRIQAAEDKFRQMKIQMEVFKPKYYIPIASFIWFSHEENFYLNDHVNTIDKVEKFVSSLGITPVVLYPGETFIPGNPHQNTASINRYLEDLKNVTLSNTTKTRSVSIETIRESAAKLKQQLKKQDKLSYLRLSLKPIKVYLSDLDQVLKFSVAGGIKTPDIPKEQADFTMTSEVFDYCLRFNWGFGTTNVNGRFQSHSEEGRKLFNYYMSMTEALNHHDNTLSRIFRKLKRKIIPG